MFCFDFRFGVSPTGVQGLFLEVPEGTYSFSARDPTGLGRVQENAVCLMLSHSLRTTICPYRFLLGKLVSG